MVFPVRLVIEADAPRLGAGEQLLQTSVVDRLTVHGRSGGVLWLGRLLRSARGTTPRDQPGHVIAVDLGQQFGRAEVIDEMAELALGVIGAGMSLADLGPIPPGDMIESQRGRCSE